MITNNRYVDVMLSLHSANSYDESLGRIQLQKYIYLVDTISVLWKVLAPKIGHQSYKHGPFDYNINNAVDSLAFRGFVKIIDMHINDEGRVDAIYHLTELGMQLCQKLIQDSTISKKYSIYNHCSVQINKRGWKQLKRMVYSEPTYVQSTAEGWGYKFDYSNLLTNDSVRILLGFEAMLEKGKSISQENFVSIYFRLLDSNG